MTIGLYEPNRTLHARLCRVMRAAVPFDAVVSVDDSKALASFDSPRVIACDGAEAENVLAMHDARIVAWSQEPQKLVALAARDDRLVSILGWPSFQSMPRAWELALATRTIVSAGPDATSVHDVLTGAPVVADFYPQTAGDRVQVVDQIGRLAERYGIADRTAARIGETAHELVINASYDAPVDESGDLRYAHDRRAEVRLAPDEIPHVQFATDGLLATVRVGDRYGRLTRDHVLASIERGLAAQRAAATEVVDASGGGAGLGLWRVYSASAATIVDVLPGHSTTVTVVFDVDIGPRDARTLPPSLHLFDRGRLG